MYKPEIPGAETNAESDASHVEEKTAEEIRESRENQSFGSRLAEYITGMRPDNPEIIPRLIEDRQKIRAKYGLPAERWNSNPDEYERFLKGIAKRLGVKIRATSDCGGFFEEYPIAGGVSFGSKKEIGTDIDKTTIDTHKESLAMLEHELIHAMQNVHSPRMPTEIREYEAYVAGFNVKALAEQMGIEGVEMLFTYFIGSSVQVNYEARSKKEKMEIVPEWNNAEYFIAHRDGLITVNSGNEKSSDGEELAV
jgi:hypothetical protein